jgi:hypothetical protein
MYERRINRDAGKESGVENHPVTMNTLNPNAPGI